MQKITSCLWFDGQAEEAAHFYTSIFKDSRIGETTYYADGMPLPKGTVLTIRFYMNGQEFLALNGTPPYKFTQAVSFVVNCVDQAEVDDYWEKLREGGGEEVQCGWLKDKYGLSWQVTPTALYKMLADPDATKAAKMLEALRPMKKIDLAALEKAFNS